MSFARRLLLVMLAVVLVSQLITAAAILRTIERDVMTSGGRELDVGLSVLGQLLEERGKQLRDNVAILTADFGFRSAVATEDANTLISVLANHGDRAGADMVLLTDPQGTPFYVMRGSSDETSLAFASDRPRVGHCAWNELVTSNPEAAKAFYFKAFGWTKDGEMDMGPMGAYEFIRHNGVIGAVMPKPDDMPVPIWHYYFRPADIDAAINAIIDNGGQILHGPDEIPGGDFIVKGFDPQGALFALVGSRRT